MARSLVAVVIGLAVAGCGHAARYKLVESDDKAEFGVVHLGGGASYVIDPRTETCLLVGGSMDGTFAVPVPCAKLKANVPAAARFITWDASADAAPSR